jgi:hypothetical protein
VGASLTGTVPNLNDSIFLMGNTSSGIVDGDNANRSIEHSHSVSATVSVTQQPSFNVPGHYHGHALLKPADVLGTTNISSTTVGGQRIIRDK